MGIRMLQWSPTKEVTVQRWGSHHGEQCPVKCEHGHPLAQGAHRRGWGGDFTVMNVLMKKQDWETEGSKGNYGQVVVSTSPECQSSSVAPGQQQEGAELWHLPEHCQDRGPNPTVCLLWGCYWSLWSKGLSQACW